MSWTPGLLAARYVMTMEFKPLSGREFPRFSAVKTFFRLPHVPPDHPEIDVAIAGVPFDGAVSFRPGARFGPSHVRDYSALGRAFHWPSGVTVFDRVKAADVGDVSVVPIDQAQTMARIEGFFAPILARGVRSLAVGGDHSITLSILRAARKAVGEPLALVHFDAHLDTYPAAWGCEYHHGAFARHAVEEGLVDPKRMLQIGLRGPLAGADDLAFVRDHGIVATTIDDIREEGLRSFIARLPRIAGPAYLTFDIDSLDPAYAPGTGTPVPGGLTTYEAQKLLQGLTFERLLGADVVEVSPPYDHAGITALAAVDVMFECLRLFGEKTSGGINRG